MKTITVVCFEEGYQHNILIYAVDVKDPENHDEVQAAVQIEREKDVDEPNEMIILFALDGDLPVLADWRD